MRASLSVPLFAGSGKPIAALNLYARDPAALAPLSSAVIVVFHAPEDGSFPAPQRLDQGSAQLISGLTAGLAVQHRIQVAIGLLMGQQKVSADLAYVLLRERAATADRSLSTQRCN